MPESISLTGGRHSRFTIKGRHGTTPTAQLLLPDLPSLGLDLNPALGTFQTAGGTAAAVHGDRVGQWVSQAAGYSWAPTITGTQLPTLHLNQLNGKPAIFFDNAAQQYLEDLTFNLFANQTKGTLYLVLDYHDDGDSHWPLAGGAGAYGVEQSGGAELYQYQGFATPQGNALMRSIMPQVLVIVFDGSLSGNARWKRFRNGSEDTLTYSGTPNAAIGAVANGLYVGRAHLATGYFHGHQYRTLYYPGQAHTTGQRQGVETYLGQQFFSALKHQFVGEGDSITFGYGAVPGTSDYVTQLLALMGATWYGRNMGLTGDPWTQLQSGIIGGALKWEDSAARYMGKKQVLTVMCGENDYNLGATLATVQTRTTTYWNQITTETDYTRIGGTLLPWTQNVPAGYETFRLAYNAWLRTQVGILFDYLADWGADARLANADDTAVYADGQHPTALGYSYMADVVRTILLTL